MVGSAETEGLTRSTVIAAEELVLVMDFGGQTAQLIARRVRDR